jgi:hypothetical protein
LELSESSALVRRGATFAGCFAAIAACALGFFAGGIFEVKINDKLPVVVS